MSNSKMKFNPDGIFGGFADPLEQRQFLALRGWVACSLKDVIQRQKELAQEG
jgi:hypothetical protein